MIKRVVINISGRVQGVSFRVYAKSEAATLGLTGFVKNEKDGSVSIVAEGPEEKLNKLLEWAKKGPAMAYVKTLRFRKEIATGEFKKFDIKY